MALQSASKDCARRIVGTVWFAPPAPWKPSPRWRRGVCTTHWRPYTSKVAQMKKRIVPRYVPTKKPSSGLLDLEWPEPPKSLLIMLKQNAPKALASAITFAQHVETTYPGIGIAVEERYFQQIRPHLHYPVYEADETTTERIDVIATFGGDGTFLRAANLYNLLPSVPPILAFNLGTLGFLSDWNFHDYAEAWRHVFMSGCPEVIPVHQEIGSRFHSWSIARGKGLETKTPAKILLRHRLQVDIHDKDGSKINNIASNALASDAERAIAKPNQSQPSLRALNEISLQRGSSPHLAIITIAHNGEEMTQTMGDGLLVSTPTGSTAYNLSAGGPIVHPMAQSIVLTPINPCSLSFRPLILPFNKHISLRISDSNRDKSLALVIDGKVCADLPRGTELRINGEFVGRDADAREWRGGVPCIMRTDHLDPWVGGLNRLLKFNRPFGRTSADEDLY